MDRAQLTNILKYEAREIGFDLVGVCAATAPPRIGQFRRWLAAGHTGPMGYLTRRVAAYEHPCHVLDGVQSLVMLGMAYRTVEPQPPGEGEGRISRYAWGLDYHDLVRQRLRLLATRHRQLARTPGLAAWSIPPRSWSGNSPSWRAWGGSARNTLLIHPRLGSWLFLAALLTTKPLVYDRPVPDGRCGACRACLDACPTGALVEPYCLDARRCISCLSIEQPGAIAPEWRAAMGDRVFGCDACQEVCPWNRAAADADPRPVAAEGLGPLPGMNPLGLVELLDLDNERCGTRFARTPLWRAKRRGLVRNAAIALGNRPHAPAVRARAIARRRRSSRAGSLPPWALGRY